MRKVFPLLLIAAATATPAFAQDLSGYTLSADIGAGVEYGPAYLGSDESEASPWIILRNGSLSRSTPSGETTDGFSIVPSFNFVGARDAGDYDALAGMDDIDRAGEIGMRLGYSYGASDTYLAVRKGFGGHSGVVGELGAKYRYSVNDRLDLTGRAEAEFGNDKFTETYFGVTDAESVTSGYDAYAPGGGFYAASVGVEARYSLTENTALLGEVKYKRLIGDAADSPLVEDRDQPSVRLGIVRRFDFRF